MSRSNIVYEFKNKRCFSPSKSQEHLESQKYLSSLIPSLKIEFPFPKIQRIADAYWSELNIVFEVQCSPITKKEILRRNRDYQKLGLIVVWIFHEKHFNRRFPSKAEKAARKKLAYYTNINSKGYGMIYDQLDTFPLFRKKMKYPICPGEPLFLKRPLLKFFKEVNTLYFKGDVIDHTLQKALKGKPKKASYFLLKLKKTFIRKGSKWLKSLLETLSR